VPPTQVNTHESGTSSASSPQPPATISAAYDYATWKATFRKTSLSLAPSGREIDAEFVYGREVLGGWVDGNLFARRQPEHIATAKPDVGGAIRFRLDL
jgi:hypothetical protein